MASFCGNCGFRSENATFCPQCGAKQSTASSPAPAPVLPGPPPAAAVAKSSSGLKILLVVFAVLGVIGLTVVGGIYYVVHKVKENVVARAHAYGVDLPDSSSSSPFTKKAHLRKPCEYLSKQEASDLLGEPIERTAVDGGSCLYFGPAGLAAKLGQEQVSAVIRRAQTPGAQPTGTDINGALNQLAGSLGAATGQTGSGGEAPLLTLIVAEDGKVQMTALMANKALFGGIAKASSEGKSGFGENIDGLGDRAVRMPPLGLNVLQGEILIRIIPGPVPGGDTKSVDIARLILKEL